MPQATASNIMTANASEDVKDYFILLKPRVMSLVIFTGLCGLLLAPGHIHPLIGFIAILCIAVGAGASGCLNMWYDRDIDGVMRRTQGRPLPQNRIQPDNALAFGVILSFGSVMVMGIAVNWLSAALLAFTIFFYVAVYTMWLKRWTPQNIVIGGAAGALPPVIGWAAVANQLTLEPWVLFAIIFLWTPPHFWALALYRHEDYQRANVPMLPVVAGVQATKVQILLYTILMVASTLVPQYLGMATSLYTYIAGGLGLIFAVLAVRVYFSKVARDAMALFAYSIFYLFLIFAGLIFDRVMS